MLLTLLYVCHIGISEMGQYLWTFSALPEDPGSVPRAPTVANTCSVIPITGDPMPFSGPHGHSMHVVH